MPFRAKRNPKSRQRWSATRGDSPNVRMRYLSPLLLSWCLPLSALGEGLFWENAWVRSMPPGTEVAAAYGRITNQSSQTMVITAIRSSVGEAAQIHDVIADGDQRRMVQLEAVSLAAGESAEFKPGGQHIMLLGVTAPPPEGSLVELCLLTANSAEHCASAPVQRQAPMPAAEPSGHHH